MRTVAAAALAVLALTALAACQDPPPPDQSDTLAHLLSARLGRRAEPHYAEREPDGVHAVCGYAGAPPRRSTLKRTAGDVAFVWAAGTLATSADGRPDFSQVLARDCPSLPGARAAR